MLNRITEELQKTNSKSLSKLFPYSTSRLLGIISSQELDILYNKLLSQLSIDLLIECGAHEATCSKSFAEKGGKAIAIEANPFVFKHITPKSFDNYISINVALSNKRDKLELFFPKNNKKSGQSTFLPKKEINYDKITVDTIQLDELLKQYNTISENIAFWFDLEGHQKEVFEGSLNTIKKCKMIKIEVEDFVFFSNQKWLSSDINTFLIKNNFIPIFRDFQYQNPFNTNEYQYNVLYISKGLHREASKYIVSAKENLTTRINLKEILIFLIKDKNILIELKHKLIQILGVRYGNYIARLFGSKSSKYFLKKTVND